MIALRLERFERMNELLADAEELILPEGIADGHACHLYTVRVNPARQGLSRDNLARELKERHGIQTVVHYPAVYEWEVFHELPHDRSDCPVADLACRSILSLPIFPRTGWDELEYIASAVKQSLAALIARSVSSV